MNTILPPPPKPGLLRRVKTFAKISLAFAGAVLPSPRVVGARIVWELAKFYAHLLSRPLVTFSAPDGSPYLSRIYLTPKANWWRAKLGLPGVFLHYFHRSDYDRDLHNHPWEWAYSLILFGGYLEERRGDWPRCYFVGDVNKLTSADFHRVTLMNEQAGTWTLFVAGARTPSNRWGFLQPDGSVRDGERGAL